MTPSDSQDGARRRDDAAYWKARWEAACERLDHEAAQTISLLAELRRRTTERDEARAELSANERSEDARLAIAEAERDEARAAQLRLLRELTATCSCGTSPMTYEGPEPDCAVHGAVRAFNEAAAELARMRTVYDAAVAFAAAVKAAADEDDDWADDPYPPLIHGLIAAVDQTAPSSPLETPHTADDGEAGVVEGAGGSEAGERLIPDAVYEAAQRAFFDAPHDPAGIDAVVPLLIAEGRRQAARQIIARDEAEGDWDINVAYWVAVGIAEGTDA